MRWFADMSGQFMLGSEDRMPEGKKGVDWQETSEPLSGDARWNGKKWVKLPAPEPALLNEIPYIGTNVTMKEKKWEIVMTDTGFGVREKV